MDVSLVAEAIAGIDALPEVVTLEAKTRQLGGSLTRTTLVSTTTASPT